MHASWLTRTRWLAVLVGVLFLLVLFSPQIQRRPLILIEQPVLLLESWLQHATGAVARALGGIAGHFRSLSAAQEENRQLQEEVARLRGDVVFLREQLTSAEQLTHLEALRGQLTHAAIVADVIGRDPTNWYATLLIDRGEDDGIRPDMGVIVPDGIVGKVIKVMPKTAVVLLLSDRNSVVAATTQRSRDEGLVEGVGDGRLRIKYLSNIADVQVNDQVVTSGLAGIFPKGLSVGTVTQVDRRAGDVSQQVLVAPAVNASRLEAVLVLPPMESARP